MIQRCSWVNTSSDLCIEYHDNEWGRAVHNDRKLFEMLILEGAQAGLSWQTVLKKRTAYKLAFDDFDPEIVARYTNEKIQNLLQNPGIIRNKLKIKSAIQNAQVFLDIQNTYGSFDQYIWEFVNNRPIVNRFQNSSDIPVKTALSERISKDLKKRGMNFVGPTIIYAYMQGIGMVNDHLTTCFLHPENQ